jgi:tetrapyrrole methylase family protein/MazG family protein
MPYNEDQSLDAIKALLKTIHRLRAPGGCPWDRKQTHQSLRPYLIEETYETIEVLDQIQSTESLRDPALKKAFIEEWGDVLLQILLHAEIASEADSTISIEAIAQQLNDKMIRRHPHVFGETQVDNADDVVKNWAQIKAAEKAAGGIGSTTTSQSANSSQGDTQNQSLSINQSDAQNQSSTSTPSVFDTIPKGMPGFQRTMNVIQKVTKVGFQWPDVKGPLEKLQEEVTELTDECHAHPENAVTAEEKHKIESELGDVLFSACNIAHFYKLDPETALRNTLRKFESRFRHVETSLAKDGKTPEQATLEEMDRYWEQAKS